MYLFVSKLRGYINCKRSILMALTEQEMKKMTVKDLREWAKENSKLVGVSGMKKDELIGNLMEEFGIEPEDKKVSSLANKADLKTEVKRLKDKMDILLQEENKNSNQLKNIRRRIRNLKRDMRTAS